jgi:hypothetical protein
MSTTIDRLNKVSIIIMYLVLIAAVCVLCRFVEISTTPEPFRYPEAMKAAVSRQLEDILHRGGYYEAEVLITGNTLQVYTRGGPPKPITQDVMLQPRIVETLHKLDIRFLEMRHLDSLLTNPVIYEIKYEPVFSHIVKPAQPKPRWHR